MLTHLRSVASCLLIDILLGDDCLINNGGCEHTCVPTPHGSRCMCNDGYQLNADKRRCGGEIFLFKISISAVGAACECCFAAFVGTIFFLVYLARHCDCLCSWCYSVDYKFRSVDVYHVFLYVEQFCCCCCLGFFMFVCWGFGVLFAVLLTTL